MDNTVVGSGARIRRAIVDRFNMIESERTIGWDRARDQEAGLLDPSSGIAVLPRGTTRVRGAVAVAR
jgi:glucose-1-phosphate adenylyltransferase